HEDPWQLTDLLSGMAARGFLQLGQEHSELPGSQQQQRMGRAATVWLQMTDTCNLRCSYCYISKNPKHMSLGTAKALVSKLAEECRIAGLAYLRLRCAGGEPTIKWDVLKPFL